MSMAIGSQQSICMDQVKQFNPNQYCTCPKCGLEKLQGDMKVSYITQAGMKGKLGLECARCGFWVVVLTLDA